MAVNHDAQDARDAQARKQLDRNRRKPIRYDADTWLIMREDPVLPAAVIRRVRHKGGEFFLAIGWDLEPARRIMTGRFQSLQEADESIRYTGGNPVMPRPGESFSEVERRRQDHARQEEEARTLAAKNYGP
jgi:hypothetical protein